MSTESNKDTCVCCGKEVDAGTVNCPVCGAYQGPPDGIPSVGGAGLRIEEATFDKPNPDRNEEEYKK